jgi:hypothetical protein
MAKDYLVDKEEKRKSGIKVLWLLLVLFVIIIFLAIKIALTGSAKPGGFNGLPTSAEAYTIAKEFVRPTLKSTGAEFDDSHYQFAKTSDSVYVIKSTVEFSDENNEKISINFKVTLKFNGGSPTSAKNWALVDMVKN